MYDYSLVLNYIKLFLKYQNLFSSNSEFYVYAKKHKYHMQKLFPQAHYKRSNTGSTAYQKL